MGVVPYYETLYSPEMFPNEAHSTTASHGISRLELDNLLKMWYYIDGFRYVRGNRSRL
jgi:hypothetical protein